MLANTVDAVDMAFDGAGVPLLRQTGIYRGPVAVEVAAEAA